MKQRRPAVPAFLAERPTLSVLPNPVDELIGGSFIIRGTLGLSSDRFWLHVAENGIEWFAATLPPADSDD